MRRYGYNTLTLGNMVRVPGLNGMVRVPGLNGMVRVPGLNGFQFADPPIIVKLPETTEETNTTSEETPSSTNWNPIIDAFKAIAVGGQKAATVVAPAGMPQWVWVAAPLAAGLAFLAIVARK